MENRTSTSTTTNKPGSGSLRRNSFSATELSAIQSSDDDMRMAAIYGQAGTMENRRISWYDGIKEGSSESLQLTNLGDADADDDRSSSASSSNTNSSTCCRISSQQRPNQLLFHNVPTFFVTPPSPHYARSFSTDLVGGGGKIQNQNTGKNSSISVNRLDANSLPRKASDPNVPSSYSSNQLFNHMPPGNHPGFPNDNSSDHCRHIGHYPQGLAGLGYLTSAAAQLRRRRPGTSATVVALSAYDKHLVKSTHTQKVMEIQHPMKGALTHMQGLLDSAFNLMETDVTRSIIEGAKLASEVLSKAWSTPRNGRNLARNLCDYMRENGYLDLLLSLYCNENAPWTIHDACGELLEKCVSAPNRAYIVRKGLLDDLVKSIKTFKEGDGLRHGVAILQALFVDNAEVNSRLIKLEALDYILDACKKTANNNSSSTFRHAALALVNLSLTSDNVCQQAMISKNVPEWLFFVASCTDDIPRYYACIAVGALVSNKEIETAVIKSGTLSIVEPFLLSHQPSDFAQCDYRYRHGHPKDWLQRLVPMLNGKRSEPRSVAAFHFALEAEVRKYHGQTLGVLEEIGAVEALKRVAALPEEVAPKFASQALQIIGEAVPYKLSQRVPEWTVEDVQYWVTQTGFEEYAPAFSEQKVDGDLLLLLTEEELARDIGMKSGLLRKRFIRELDSLKILADYRNIDDTKLDNFLVSIHPRFSIYTYRLLEMGVNRAVLPALNEEVLKNDCHIINPVHRTILLQALEAQTNIDDVEVALLSKKIDIFISYRRSTGNQLASLIKVLLQLRGYKVFIDVERLPAGQFDYTLLKNIQAAKHFVLVLTQGALDRCVGDEMCNDWVHKEVLCALENNKNIIPVFDANFDFPEETSLPADMRAITKFNGLHWIHEYQDACLDKLEKFIHGECIETPPLLTRRSSIRRSASKLSIGGSSACLVSSASANDLLAIGNRSRTTSMNSVEPSYFIQQVTADASAPDIVIDYCV